LQAAIQVEEITMRINLNPGSPEVSDAAKPTSTPDSRGGVSAASGKTSSGVDRAELSLDQVRVSALAAKINDLPEVRQEKVAALADAIHSGNYNVSPEQTAEAMLSEMLGNVA
jgi:flagellar biosynthesis anti-sigma factor FlgM